MSVDQTDVVDFISINQTGHVVLTISDHLDWSDSIEHQSILQTKLNKYLAFVESGEILERFPQANGRKIIFEVVCLHPPDSDGRGFLSRVQEIIEKAGFEFSYRGLRADAVNES